MQFHSPNKCFATVGEISFEGLITISSANECFATVDEIKKSSNTFHPYIQKPISSPDEMFSSANESFATEGTPYGRI